VLVVDDAPEARRALRRSLEAFGHEVVEAQDGHEGLALAGRNVDLILLDVEMPGLDGFAFMERLRADPERFNLPVIMVTGHDHREQRLQAVASGVNDFIGKPFDLLELRMRSEAQLRLKASRDAVERQRDDLEQEVLRRTAALRRAFEDLEAAHRREREAHLSTLRALVLAAEYRDWDTAAHIERISGYCEVLARGLGLARADVERIRLASPQHDVGKIGIPDSILLKPGPLDSDEWAIMRQHPEIGARILGGNDADLLRAGRLIALTHHEKWDGSGYPRGLAGEEIPLEGRICAVADVFDALTTDRRYRKALPNEEVYGIVRRERGVHFDPAVVDVFFHELERIEDVQRTYAERRWQ